MLYFTSLFWCLFNSNEVLLIPLNFLNLNEFNSILFTSIEILWILHIQLNPNESTKFQLIPLILISFHWIPLKSFKSYCIPPNSTYSHWIPLSADEFHWIPIYSIEIRRTWFNLNFTPLWITFNLILFLSHFYWIPLKAFKLHWISLSCK